jgi:Bax inhibitor 1
MFNTSNFSFQTIANVKGNLSRGARVHLVGVYALLAGTLWCSVVGAFLHFSLNIGGLLSGILALAGVLVIAMTPSNPQNDFTRMIALLAVGLFKGASIGPLLAVVAAIDPGLVVSALVGTAIIFMSLSACAWIFPRRSTIFLYGGLSSALSLLAMVSMLSLFFGGSSALFAAQLYIGLIVFLGFVLVDTQLIIESAEAGSRDVVAHSLKLFLDFFAIFVRILIILARQSGRRNKRNNDQNNSRRR